MRGRVRHRLEKLEQALRPKGRVFFMWDDSPHGHLHGAQSRPAAQMAQGCSSLGRRRTTPVTAELMCFLDLGSYRTAWLMAQRILEALYRRRLEKRARPATLHVLTEGDATQHSRSELRRRGSSSDLLSANAWDTA